MLDNLQNYHAVWGELNRELSEVAASAQGLDAALRALHAQQVTLGFVRDDLSHSRRYLLFDPGLSGKHFSAQFNPPRAQRFAGAGLKEPPPGVTSLNGGCFLCPENVQWQQEGREFGFELSLEDRSYVAWMNPYPLLPNNTVIASREHIPQSWRLNGSPRPPKSICTIVGDLLILAARLPGWFGFYNGEGAVLIDTGTPQVFNTVPFPLPVHTAPAGLRPVPAGTRRRRRAHGQLRRPGRLPVAVRPLARHRRGPVRERRTVAGSLEPQVTHAAHGQRDRRRPRGHAGTRSVLRPARHGPLERTRYGRPDRRPRSAGRADLLR